MIKAAEMMGWVDGIKVIMETLLSIKRAGADTILTYSAMEAARELGTMTHTHPHGGAHLGGGHGTKNAIRLVAWETHKAL